MRKFADHIEQKLKDERFHIMYEEERQMAELAIRLAFARERSGKTQKDVAREARITQQQLSRLENGARCNVNTLLKVCNALGLTLELKEVNPPGIVRSVDQVSES